MRLLSLRLLASAITVAFLVALGFGLAPTYWRETALITCFVISKRGRCPGMWLVGLDWEQPPRAIYAAIYTGGVASVLYSIFFPGDLLLMYGLGLQAPCYLMTGNTFHGWMSGTASRTRLKEPSDIQT